MGRRHAVEVGEGHDHGMRGGGRSRNEGNPRMNATPTFRELTHAMRPQDLHGDGIRVDSHHF